MKLVAMMVAAALGLGVGPAATGHWLNAIEVPGTAALNGTAPFPLAELNSLSCVPGGFCAAGGFYTDHAGHTQAFVAVRRDDRWGKAIEVPGTAGLNKKNAEVASVSCASAGHCAAGGTYEDSRFGGHAFVVTLRDGRWARAVKVPGIKAGRARFSEVTSVSCTSAGCVAGGNYAAHGVDQPFVAAERGGRWEAAANLPGMATLNVGGLARLIALSCPSAGNCLAAGQYAPRKFLGRPFGTKVFAAAERNGRWGAARQVRTPATLKVSDASFDALSCPSAGNCTLAGNYANTTGSSPSFVISERRGRWGTPVAFPSTSIGIIVLSCGAPGNCLAGGEVPGATVQQSLAYLVSERNGRWGKPFQAPGTARLNTGEDAGTEAVSCWSAGNCIAGGTYTNTTSSQAFAVTEVNGRWGAAFEVPGTGQLNAGRNATVTVLSCTAGGTCGVGGDYSAGPGGGQSGDVFVATRT